MMFLWFFFFDRLVYSVTIKREDIQNKMSTSIGAFIWPWNGGTTEKKIQIYPYSLLTFLGAYLSGDPLGALVN